jgi:hypothetical protein
MQSPTKTENKHQRMRDIPFCDGNSYMARENPATPLLLVDWTSVGSGSLSFSSRLILKLGHDRFLPYPFQSIAH